MSADCVAPGAIRALAQYVVAQSDTPAATLAAVLAMRGVCRAWRDATDAAAEMSRDTFRAVTKRIRCTSVADALATIDATTDGATTEPVIDGRTGAVHA